MTLPRAGASSSGVGVLQYRKVILFTLAISCHPEKSVVSLLWNINIATTRTKRPTILYYNKSLVQLLVHPILLRNEEGSVRASSAINRLNNNKALVTWMFNLIFLLINCFWFIRRPLITFPDCTSSCQLPDTTTFSCPRATHGINIYGTRESEKIIIFPVVEDV